MFLGLVGFSQYWLENHFDAHGLTAGAVVGYEMGISSLRPLLHLAKSDPKTAHSIINESLIN